MKGRKGNLTWKLREFEKDSEIIGRTIVRKRKPAKDNRCGVDSRTAWTCAPCKIVSQLRHNHVVPALTGRCICVWSMYKYNLSQLCIRGRPNTSLCLRYLFLIARGDAEGLCICIYKSRNHHVVFSVVSLFFHSFFFVSFFSHSFPSLLLHFRTPHHIYLCMYICIYSESSHLNTRRKSPWKQSNTGKRHQPIIAPSSTQEG